MSRRGAGSRGSPPTFGRKTEGALSLFEFILIMTSVIFALSVAQVLSGVSRLAQAGGEVRTFLAHTLWVVLLFTAIFLSWWATWEFRGVDWAFPQYAYLLLAPILLFFSCSLILPDDFGGASVDLEAHFFKVRRPLMWSWLVFTVVIVLDGPFLGTESVVRPIRFAHAVWLVAAAWGIRSTHRTTHIILAIAVLTTMGVLITTRFWSVS